MRSHHRTFSARTETKHNLRRHLLALAIGGAISMTAFGAYGMDSPRGAETTRSAFTGLPLPPIPYLDTMPWMKWQPEPARMKIDILLPPSSAPTSIFPQQMPGPNGPAATS
ncbi:hypothetical protein [Bradyrhizobium sp. I71]|jgi:hypothetical protein|uniref:hypothetical protein n=1 Tax=Bradyrhizobium sp. I71 TaxID=2590772 RepID=UPI001EF8930A|nr:hypothetical protein [Bradyrhizobium sp. I71]ULK94938.1 hypothetical protein FJV43_19140 [Bradyrhizobium sp. I71]